ncbi:MAG: hypothetical protein CO138_01635 [Candidatus Moranbacteria bacterium CG_4_9_14_3_um_filter_33_15]|nr:MAG: hypothetical protein CO138_01635 [Candidatus Moranbacteria bacterium CG_4_9_14_3_um_filter_33_15]
MDKTYNRATDEQIVEFSKNNPDAYEALVLRYWDKLFYFIKRIAYFSNEDTEDVLQEVFIKVYRYLNDFDDSFKFSTWIYQITRNCVVDEIRKKNSRAQNANLSDEEMLKIFRSSANLEKEIIAKDQVGKIKNIINNLPFKYREIMILRFIEEKNYSEIMEIVKKPKGTVAALIMRGRKIIMEEAKKQELFL